MSAAKAPAAATPAIGGLVAAQWQREAGRFTEITGKQFHQSAALVRFFQVSAEQVHVDGLVPFFPQVVKGVLEAAGSRYFCARPSLRVSAAANCCAGGPLP